ncbi:sigma-70 family RNA polymerase sigma factor [uncultured Bacteroides sp.]|uniref:sigma-70 family RNA polymerase sigma factor n=1 Tax=uncultured Bacteroides sp. TaxID=162156 RepID=UPI002AA8FB55|nr:sigma-70 family RNA polymerase sigma factor [uncultured Bacteroides sp.]
MKNLSNSVDEGVVARSYEEYYQIILKYITYRINHKYEAEDLVQDVFMRLLDYEQMLREDTVKYFLFTIARNIVTDYIRRYYKKQEVTSYMYDISITVTNETEENLIARDILSLERSHLQTFPTQRKIIYSLSRFDNETTDEISEKMNLSRRTIENHLLLGRKCMRAYIRKCI